MSAPSTWLTTDHQTELEPPCDMTWVRTLDWNTMPGCDQPARFIRRTVCPNCSVTDHALRCGDHVAPSSVCVFCRSETPHLLVSLEKL